MRWPLSLLFRGERAAPPAAGDAAAAGPGGPGLAAGPALPAGAPARPPAWNSLPPVRRTAGEIPLTASAAAFARDLAGRRPPERILRPLAHDVALDGPAGLVSGIATTLVPRSSTAATDADGGAARPARPAIQRGTRTTSVAAPPDRGTVAATESEVDDAPPRDASPDRREAPRALPTVPPSSASRALAATQVASASAPEPVRALAPATAPPVQRGPGSGGPGAAPAGTALSEAPAFSGDGRAAGEPRRARPRRGGRGCRIPRGAARGHAAAAAADARRVAPPRAGRAASRAAGGRERPRGGTQPRVRPRGPAGHAGCAHDGDDGRGAAAPGRRRGGAAPGAARDRQPTGPGWTRPGARTGRRPRGSRRRLRQPAGVGRRRSARRRPGAGAGGSPAGR